VSNHQWTWNYCSKPNSVKGKAVPLQAWCGPEGSRKLRFPDFVTMAQDGGKVVSLMHRPPLPPTKYPWYSFLLDNLRVTLLKSDFLSYVLLSNKKREEKIILQRNIRKYVVKRGTAVAQWLRCCATNPKVTCSIPDGFIGIFHCYNPSNRAVALGSTQPLTEMSTRSISWG